MIEMLAKRKAAFAAILFFMCGLPQTTEYISGLQTSCKTAGTVEEGKPTVIYFNLTSDPMEGKLNYADICLKRGQVTADAADSKNGKAGEHGCTGDRIFSAQWQDPGNRLTYSVNPGYKFVDIVDNQLTLLLENVSRNQSGEYFIEDSSNSPWLNCSLNVTGAMQISGPGEDREEKPTQKSVQDTDGTWWLWLGSVLSVVWTVPVTCILGYIIWYLRDIKNWITGYLRDIKNLIQMVIKMLDSIKDNNEGRGTQHPRTNEGSEDMVGSAGYMGYAARLQRNQSPQEANDDAATDSTVNVELPVDVEEAQDPQQQPEQQRLLQVPMPVSDQSCFYAESTF